MCRQNRTSDATISVTFNSCSRVINVGLPAQNEPGRLDEISDSVEGRVRREFRYQQEPRSVLIMSINSCLFQHCFFTTQCKIAVNRNYACNKQNNKFKNCCIQTIFQTLFNTKSTSHVEC